MHVSPGDWVVADGSGVVFVSQGDLDRISRVVAHLVRKERSIAARIDQGSEVAQALEQGYESMLEEAP